MNCLLRTSAAAKQNVMVHHDDASTRKNTRHVSLDNITAAAELQEHDAYVAFQPQQVRQIVDTRHRLGVDKDDTRRVQRRQS